MYLGYQEASKEPVELKEVIGKLSGVPEYGNRPVLPPGTVVTPPQEAFDSDPFCFVSFQTISESFSEAKESSPHRCAGRTPLSAFFCFIWFILPE